MTMLGQELASSKSGSETAEDDDNDDDDDMESSFLDFTAETTTE
jgi:hypothetical protein